MNIRKLRRILGDAREPYQWSDEELQEWIEDADEGGNEYLLAAEILGVLYGQLVFDGAGSSVRSDDITINDYNNAVLLRERIKDLKNQGNSLNVGSGLVVEFPYVRY